MLRKISQLNNQVCPWWLMPTFDNPLRRLIHNPNKILAGLVAEGQTALDIGCGMGYFTIPMAHMVGIKGQLIAIDLQARMLNGVRKRALRAGVAERVRLHRGDLSQVNLAAAADFALMFWMAHEVPEQEIFLRQVSDLLKPGAGLLLVEPLLHVSAAAFQRTVGAAQTAGLEVRAEPKVKFSRAVLMARLSIQEFTRANAHQME